MTAGLQAADTRLLTVLRTRGHPPRLERAVVAFSRWGEHSRIWFAVSSLGIAAHGGRRSVYVRAAGTVAVVEVVNALAKLAFRRRRPELPHLPVLMATRSARSFPSAHASTSFAAARLLSDAVPGSAVYLVAAAMAFSRPYLGVHYPSDVVGGALLGTAIGRLVEELAFRIR